MRTFLAWLEASGLDGDPLTDAHDRDFTHADLEDAVGRLPTDQ
ncbi:hypothetical protein [Actinomadura sp. HBU206391]|nr:hypothetical protein [Actinomadura sp. HBU206391]